MVLEEQELVMAAKLGMLEVILVLRGQALRQLLRTGVQRDLPLTPNNQVLPTLKQVRLVALEGLESYIATQVEPVELSRNPLGLTT